jgi:tRNA-specific 2-thiouridylase
LVSKKIKETQKVVVGMTGGVDSTVAAYLLKKQGLDPIGITINFYKEGTGGLSKDEYLATCQNRDLTKVQDICDRLEIPFYGVNAFDHFKESVLDRVLTAKLSGHGFTPCVYCNVLKFDILLEKAKKLGAQSIATGHYAKVVKNIKTGKFMLISANDVSQDQSYYLSRLEKRHLEHLILPCADIRRSEVENISSSLGINFNKGKKRNSLCFMFDSQFPSYVKKSSPPGMITNGGIFNYEDGSPVADHDGIHNYYIGQNKIESLDNITIDEDAKVVGIDHRGKNVYISKTKNIRFSTCVLGHYVQDFDTDISAPVKVFSQFGQLKERRACFLYFKNNDTVQLRFSEEVLGILNKGMHVAIYNGPGSGAKVIGNGTVTWFGHFDNTGKFRRLPDPEEIELELYSSDDLELDLKAKLPAGDKGVDF